MTIREKLSDWISGGALTKARNECDEIRDFLYLRGSTLNAAWRAIDDRDDILGIFRNVLRQIASLETPKANATVRKMARIARGWDMEE